MNYYIIIMCNSGVLIGSDILVSDSTRLIRTSTEIEYMK